MLSTVTFNPHPSLLCLHRGLHRFTCEANGRSRRQWGRASSAFGAVDDGGPSVTHRKTQPFEHAMRAHHNSFSSRML